MRRHSGVRPLSRAGKIGGWCLLHFVQRQRILRDETDDASDRLGRCRCVAGHHDDADAGHATSFDGRWHVRPRRVDEGDETDEAQSGRREIPGVSVEHVVAREALVPVAEAEHPLAESAEGIAGGVELVEPVGAQRQVGAVDVDCGAAFDNSLRSAFHQHDVTAFVLRRVKRMNR